MKDNTKPPVDRADGRMELDAAEFNEIIRDQLGEAPTEEPEVEEKSKDVKEPKGEPEVEEEPEEESDVVKALKTIERLEAEIAELRSRGVGAGKSETEEPSIELEEVLANVRLPKDHSKWAIQLKDDDLRRVGIDPEITPGLNVLANAFYQFIVDTLVPLTTGQMEARLESRARASEAMSTFFDRYPDLEGQDDLLEMVERKVVWPQYGQKATRVDYIDRLAEAARERVARLRGISLDEYKAALKGSPGASRAVTTSTGRSRRSTSTSDQEKEMLDLL